MTDRDRLGVAFIGSGFVAGFHMEAWVGVRGGDIAAIYSRNEKTSAQLADRCRELGIGDPATYQDLAETVRDPNVDAVWLTTPNHVRVQMVEAICDEVRSGRADLVGIAIEKPLGRTTSEARQIVGMVEDAGLLHGYLENQVFAPDLDRARELVWARGAAISGAPYLARCAEEHSGPHRAWFWSGQYQGGGVLNDMMCHSVEAGRHLLCKPGEDTSSWMTPVSVTANIASLKWTRDTYADVLEEEYGGEVDYRTRPAEDYARAMITFENGDGQQVVAEASTSWSYVGAGLRLTFELLGPEYSMQVNTLDAPAKIFLSRRLAGPEGEDLVEKQNAEQGLMPVLASEPVTYGYQHEDRHMVDAFLAGRQPDEDLYDGLLVSEMLMACYLSAELGETVKFPVANIDDFVPKVAQGTWNPHDVPKVSG